MRCIRVESRANLEHQTVLDLEMNFPSVAIFLDENMKCIAVEYPLKETDVRSKRNDGIALNV